MNFPHFLSRILAHHESDGQQCTADSESHVHRAPNGRLVTCYHKCKNVVASPGFWFGMTMGFPVEHFLWEHVWPFKIVSHWLGL